MCGGVSKSRTNLGGKHTLDYGSRFRTAPAAICLSPSTNQIGKPKDKSCLNSHIECPKGDISIGEGDCEKNAVCEEISKRNEWFDVTYE